VRSRGSFRPSAILSCLAVAMAVTTLMSTRTSAYALSGPSWSLRPVSYLVNTSNLDLPDDAVELAVRTGADVWAQQTNASFAFSFAGRSAQTTNTNDGINLVMFRNASNGSVIATTYWWSSGSNLIDADIVFWDGGFSFFAGTTGCSNGFYIEDIAAHEFGHALGLGHSTSPSATMYPSVAYCDMGNRTLDADDIAGVVALYPPSTALEAPKNVRIIPYFSF
jgi:hypothetical protein